MEPTAFGGGRRFAPLWGAFGAPHRFVIVAGIILLYFVKTILHVALDLKATHTSNVIMARHPGEIMHDFEIVYQTFFFIRGTLRIQLVPFNACTHPAAWFCGNAHPFGWLDFAFVETPIPLDGLICILMNWHGFVETPIPLDGLILLLWKRPSPWMA